MEMVKERKWESGPDALVTIDDVLREYVPTSRSGFAALRRETDFPKPIRLRPNGRRKYFRAGDVVAWLTARERA